MSSLGKQFFKPRIREELHFLLSVLALKSLYLAMYVRYMTTDNLQLDKVNILTGIIRVFVVHSALTTSLPIFRVYVLNHNENLHH